LLILTRADVERVLTMSMAIEGCRRAYIAVSQKQATVPERHAVHVPECDGDMLVMSGYLPGFPSLGLKVVSTFTGNRQYNLPSTQGAIILLDPRTGTPQVLMDGSLITAVRTGAGSGMATQLLAREDADSLAILGTGGMAWDQFQAMRAVRPVKRVYVWNRTRERAAEFAQRVAAEHPEMAVEVTGTPDDAVANSLLVCAATASPEPVVHGAAMRPGTHVNLTGAHRPEWREIDSAGVQRAKVRSVDSLTSGLRPGDFSQPIQAGEIRMEQIAEIGAIATDPAKGRASADEITLFKSVGLAAQDLAVAFQVREAARAAGLGIEIEI
jgi:ornithine cyclodeaminase/alanine dehydrogenase-like protein (mu-crystallin family)